MTTCPSNGRSNNRQGLFIRKASRNKVRLSMQLSEQIKDRVVVTVKGGRYRLASRSAGGGSRSVHRLGLNSMCITHADLWKAMPDERVYLAEVEPGVWEALA